MTGKTNPQPIFQILFSKVGQSTIEALVSVLIIISTTSLMFHSGIGVLKYIASEQELTEKTLFSFSKLHLK